MGVDFKWNTVTIFMIHSIRWRFIAEFWREPDVQLGFICCDWMTVERVVPTLKT
jgi:phosphatidylglycerol---prolipoprotein diacylglyceryl transferase